MTSARTLPIVWSPLYEVDIGVHVFPTAKYRLVVERLEADGLLGRDQLRAPTDASWEDLRRVHTSEYVRKVRELDFSYQEVMRMEVPVSPELRDAWILCCGGTTLTGEVALEAGVAAHIGGGFHHAFAGHGEGFCLLNDVAIAARTLMARGAVESVAVVDLDVHHGNGTAAIFENDPAVSTLSMHQENNYPAIKPPSDLDIGLADRTGDDEYLSLLSRHLPTFLEDSEPDLVFYLAVADPYQQDQLGGLDLTKGGLLERDRRVLQACGSAGVPVAIVLAGGYAVQTQGTVEIHSNTVQLALP